MQKITFTLPSSYRLLENGKTKQSITLWQDENLSAAFVEAEKTAENDELLGYNTSVEWRGDTPFMKYTAVNKKTITYRIFAIGGEDIFFNAEVVGELKNAVVYEKPKGVSIFADSQSIAYYEKADVTINYPDCPTDCNGNIAYTELFGRKSPRYFLTCGSFILEVASRKSFADCLLLPIGGGSCVSVCSENVKLLTASEARNKGFNI